MLLGSVASSQLSVAELSSKESVSNSMLTSSLPNSANVVSSIYSDRHRSPRLWNELQADDTDLTNFTNFNPANATTCSNLTTMFKDMIMPGFVLIPILLEDHEHYANLYHDRGECGRLHMAVFRVVALARGVFYSNIQGQIDDFRDLCENS